jgi:NAD(P)-dependent dehydrogenase (short-subunit alcohol dehydrogenase family)
MFPNIALPGAKAIFDGRYWGLYPARTAFSSCADSSRAGAVIAAKYAAKGLVTDSLTCTSGSVDVDPLPGFSVMSGTSGALTAMTRGLALDLAPVRANCIALGLVDTEMHRALPDAVRQQMYKSYEERMPIKHVGTPGEVAEGGAGADRVAGCRLTGCCSVPLHNEVHVRHWTDRLRRWRRDVHVDVLP